MGWGTAGKVASGSCERQLVVLCGGVVRARLNRGRAPGRELVNVKGMGVSAGGLLLIWLFS